MNIAVDRNNGFTYNWQSFWNFKGELEFVDKWFLMGSPVLMLGILMAYLLFVTKLGPYIMRNRKPFTLTNVLLVYNVAEVVLSSYMFYTCMKIIIPLGLLQKTCNMETEESRYTITSANHLYLICKLTELLDTVFFVLRKKQKQISFLHVYHHFLLAGCTWMLLKYEPGYTLLFTGTINSLVHIFMYFYYGLSAFPSLAKYLWWKKYITKLQLVQFCMIILHFAANTATSECKPSKILSFVLIFNIFLFIYLFLEFYAKSYKKSCKLNKEGMKSKNGYNIQETMDSETLKRRAKDTNVMKENMTKTATKYFQKKEQNSSLITNRPIGENL